MLIPITTVAELGMLVRAARHTQGLRLDDAAGSAGVGPVFAGEFERGKESVQLGLVLKLLDEVGLQLKVDVPDKALPEFQALQAKGLRPLRPRRSKKAASV
ncbi:helix-turn-helix domain-containing protein [Rhodoferax sp.]|uniref:helix-turn-helix domain-containing protein n=1 Tax=Rhodoferax sp. TaxID=50421 RepID=UPI00262D824B|nr:helix-turn-helix domain-containing protein [Rhodoferax sp.]MDD2927179.1 helix-turn-helix domain-containing protein [Rhodoferax sp.]